MDTSPDSFPTPPPAAYDNDTSNCSIDEMIAEVRSSLQQSRPSDKFAQARLTSKDTIHPNSTIWSPDIIAPASDDGTAEQHPLIRKLAHFLSHAQKYYSSPLTIKASHRACSSPRCREKREKIKNLFPQKILTAHSDICVL